MARRRKNDSGLEGLLLVDKPEGPTSFDVVAKMRRALGTRAIGHTGTLDPCANGLLVLLVGRYTRLSNYLTQDDKLYVGQVRFGSSTTSDDREGDILETGDPSGVTREILVDALAAMQGPCEQRPPAFSAVSVGGERLYMKARRGEVVDVPVRQVVLHELELLSFENNIATIRVLASKGTYIRSLARDLGEVLGVPAHLAALRRLRSGVYDVENALPLEDLCQPTIAAAALKTGPQAILGVPLISIGTLSAAALAQGKRIDVPHLLSADVVGLAHCENDPIALVRSEDGRLRSVRGFGPPPSRPHISHLQSDAAASVDADTPTEETP